MSDAELFKLVDVEAGKTVGFYHSLNDAEMAGERLYRVHPELRDALLLVGMDANGMPVSRERLVRGPTSPGASSLMEALRSSVAKAERAATKRRHTA